MDSSEASLGGYSTEGDNSSSRNNPQRVNRFKQSAEAQRERRTVRAQRAAAKAQIAALQNQGKGSKVRKGK